MSECMCVGNWVHVRVSLCVGLHAWRFVCVYHCLCIRLTERVSERNRECGCGCGCGCGCVCVCARVCVCMRVCLCVCVCVCVCVLCVITHSHMRACAHTQPHTHNAGTECANRAGERRAATVCVLSVCKCVLTVCV